MSPLIWKSIWHSLKFHGILWIPIRLRWKFKSPCFLLLLCQKSCVTRHGLWWRLFVRLVRTGPAGWKKTMSRLGLAMVVAISAHAMLQNVQSSYIFLMHWTLNKQVVFVENPLYQKVWYSIHWRCFEELCTTEGYGLQTCPSNHGKSLSGSRPLQAEAQQWPEKSLAYIACIAHASSALPVSRIVLRMVVLAGSSITGFWLTKDLSNRHNYVGRPCLEGCLWANSTSQLVWWFLFQSHHDVTLTRYRNP